MEKFLIATGKTIDAAVASALAELQLERDSVSVEVLENPKSGFLGLGGQPAKIKVTYEGPDDAPAPALSSASRSKPKQPKPAAAPAAAETAQPKPEASRPSAPASEASTSAPAPKAEPKHYEPAAPGSVEERAEQFVQGLLEHMGSNAVPHASRVAEDTVLVDLVGESLGMLIGRRGETLDAIQHLTNYAINRDTNKRTRINVDAENYRAKREEALARLANKVAGKVVKYRRNMTLEPMNAYERHVIHAALQEHPNVSTYSTGSEPNRRVVVAYTKYQSNPSES